MLQVLDEVEQEKHRGNIVANVNGLVFTRDDGRAINKDMITQAIRLARNRAGVSDFAFMTTGTAQKHNGRVKAFTLMWL